MWTMRRDFPEQFTSDTASIVDRDNISNVGREAFATLKNKSDPWKLYKHREQLFYFIYLLQAILLQKKNNLNLKIKKTYQK